VAIGTGQAVYMSATARQLAGAERMRALDVYSRRSVEHGGSVWTVADVEPPARFRLYGAVAVEHSVLDAHDRRVAVSL